MMAPASSLKASRPSKGVGRVMEVELGWGMSWVQGGQSSESLQSTRQSTGKERAIQRAMIYRSAPVYLAEYWPADTCEKLP